jgi:hypothetical protein
VGNSVFSISILEFEDLEGFYFGPVELYQLVEEYQ